MEKSTYAFKDCEQELNEIGCKDEDLYSNGGRVPDWMVHNYGTWLRRNDHTAFNVFHQEHRDRDNGEDCEK